MALPENYWNNVQQKIPAKVGSVISDDEGKETIMVGNKKTPEELQVAKNLRAAIGKSQQEYYEKEARRSVLSRMPYEMTNVVFGLPEEEKWKEMGAIDKTKHLSTQAAKGTIAIAKAIPKELIKAPLKIEQSIFDLEMYGMQKIFPTILGKELTREDIKRATGRGTSRDINIPFYGKEKIGGVAHSYERGIEMGFGKWGAGITASGELAGDVLMSLTGVNLLQGLSRPRWTQMKGTHKTVRVAGVDYQALTQKQILGIKAKYVAGKIKAKISNKNTTYHKLDKPTAKEYGGTISNRMGKVTHIGKGIEEYSVMELKGSLTSKAKDALIKKFGRDKVVEGEFGTEVKLYSQMIKSPKAQEIGVIEGQVVTKDITGWDKMTDIQKAEAMGVEPIVGAVPKKAIVDADMSVAKELAVARETASERGLPSLMKRPIKGSEKLVVTDKHIEQVESLAVNRGIPDGTAQAISKAYNGKSNLNELTREELYAVSEGVRAFPNSVDAPWDFSSRVSPTMRLLSTRGWASIAETKSARAGFYHPTDTMIRIPISLGIMNMRNMEGAWRDTFRGKEFFGKYSKDKFYELRRLIPEHIRGDKNAIIKNDALSPEVKKDLLKISEQTQKYFKDNKGVFAEAGTYGSEYMPEYKIFESGFPAFYKEAELPKELSVASQFERKGQFNVLQDDALRMLEIYSSMVAKVKHLKIPYENATKILEKLPEKMKKQSNDWMQEVMGRSGELEKQFNAWSEALSKKKLGIGKLKLPEGTIPADLAHSTIRRGLSYSYGAGMGLPGVMPPIRNVYMQSFVFPFADFGPEYLVWLAKQMINPKKIKANVQNIRDIGAEVKGGVFYGGELGQTTGRGIIGKTADIYEKASLALLHFYGKSDLFNRSNTGGYAKDRFNKAWDDMRNNKISVDEFERKIDMESYSQPVQQYLRNDFKKNTKESLKEAEVLLQSEKIDQLQYGYRKGSVSSLHYGLGGKALGQFTQYQWGYATMIGEWTVRKQWIKLIRLLGMGEASRRAAADTLGIDISSWTGTGPAKLPISPMANIFMGTAEEIQAALNDQGNTKEFNKNYKEIMRAVELYGGVATGAGATGRWANIKYSIDRYEKTISGESMFPLPMDLSNPDRVFGLWMKPIAKDTQPSIIRPVTFGELLSYGFGFQDIRGGDEWSAMREVDKANEEKRIATKRYIYYLENGEHRKAEDTMIKYQLEGDVIRNAMPGQTKSILQRKYENMSIKDKIKWGPLFGPLIYGEEK